VSGGDFAAAIAAGNPVIGKANSSHPGTTCLLAREAHAAAQAAGLPAGTIQLLYRLDHRDGQRLVADPRLGATGYTGSRAAGLKLKAAADAAGKPIYLELSSINPVVILPGALRERGEQIIDEFATSALMGPGQFCTNPGIAVMIRGDETEAFLTSLARNYQSAPVGTLLSASVEKSLCDNIGKLVGAGATPVAGGTAGGGSGYSFSNTLLSVSGARFLAEPEMLQTEAFGNAGLVIVADDAEQAGRILEHMEGSLTGCIYSDSRGSEDTVYEQLSQILRPLVGRLLNDKMTTGVAVSPAMNHGGPYPATAHPGFTAVGIPAALSRFATLQCYDNVRQRRLPACLADKNPNGIMWRQIDGCWTQGDVGG
jgi:NADP-dependent aldehyde dehydrogenase